MRSKKFDEKKEEILQWVKENRSKAFICKEMDCRPSTLDHYFKEISIIYAGNMGCKGYRRPAHKIPVKEYLGTGKLIRSHALKLKLIEEGVKEKKCERCGLEKWLSKDIPLELHHINQNRFDNRLENLEILCSNCHALENSKIKRRIDILERFCLNCNKKIEVKDSHYRKYCSNECIKEAKRKIKKIRFCLSCSNEFSGRNKKFCSELCKKEHDKTLRKFEIEKDVLEKLVNSVSTSKIARILGVTDNAVSHRCKRLGIKKPPRGFWAKKCSGKSPDITKIDKNLIDYLQKKGYRID